MKNSSIFLIFFGCQNDNIKNQEIKEFNKAYNPNDPEELTTLHQHDSIKMYGSWPLLKESVNSRIKNNFDSTQKSVISKTLKQGEIITRNQDNSIVAIKNYANDTLDGYYFSYEGMQKDGFYRKGKKDGYFRTYYDDKKDEKVMLIAHYKHDTLMWYAHPASDEQYIYNPKGFDSPFDSIYIKVPFVNGEIWYEGLFINNKEVGLHTIYKKAGGIYAIADYHKSLVYFPDNSDTLSLTECGYKKIEL